MAIRNVLLRDIGLEFEFPNMTEIELRNMTQYLPNGWRAEHDGSTQRLMKSIKSIYTGLHFDSVPNFIEPYCLIDKTGAELVSPIIRTDNNKKWKDDISSILHKVQDEYFGFLDPKCSFHCHVNMTGAPVFVLQNIINIWASIEAVMYRIGIGEMGYHRGKAPSGHNYLYCRPLVSPQVVIDGEHLRPSFDHEKLMLASNLAEFFMALGNTPTDIDPDKYNPVRYGSLNFFNFIRYGTVEFRVFNLSYNTKYVLAWIELCQAICKSAFGKPFEGYPQMLLGYSGDFQFELLQVMLGLSDETMVTLYELFHMNKWVEFNNPSWQFTHVPNNTANWVGIDKKFIPDFIDGQIVRVYPDKNAENYREITLAEEVGGAPRKVKAPPKRRINIELENAGFNAILERVEEAKAKLKEIDPYV
jgi:hypothetical protein